MTLIIQRKPIVYDAVQFGGVLDLPTIQVFLAPVSPHYGKVSGDTWTLMVNTRDHESERKWPGLGRQYHLSLVNIGDYIVKDEDGDVSVISQQQMAQDYNVMEGGALSVAAGDDITDAVDDSRLPPPAFPTLPPHDQIERTPFGLGGEITATHPRALNDD